MNTDWQPGSDEEQAWREAFERSALTPERNLVEDAFREALPSPVAGAPRLKRWLPLMIASAAAIAILAAWVLVRGMDSGEEVIAADPENYPINPEEADAWAFDGDREFGEEVIATNPENYPIIPVEADAWVFDWMMEDDAPRLEVKNNGLIPLVIDPSVRLTATDETGKALELVKGWTSPNGTAMVRVGPGEAHTLALPEGLLRRLPRASDCVRFHWVANSGTPLPEGGLKSSLFRFGNPQAEMASRDVKYDREAVHQVRFDWTRTRKGVFEGDIKNDGTEPFILDDLIERHYNVDVNEFGDDLSSIPVLQIGMDIDRAGIKNFRILPGQFYRFQTGPLPVYQTRLNARDGDTHFLQLSWYNDLGSNSGTLSSSLIRVKPNRGWASDPHSIIRAASADILTKANATSNYLSAIRAKTPTAGRRKQLQKRLRVHRERIKHPIPERRSS